MIEALYIAANSGEPMRSVNSLELVAGKGIVGDRNFDCHVWPGQNLTLIEAESIETFNERYNRGLRFEDLRRSVVTRGDDLNALETQRFFIGDVCLQGVELCEPCKTLGERLQTAQMTPAQSVKAWVNRGGLRCTVLTGGVIRLGQQLALTSII